MVGTIAIAVAKGRTFENRTILKSDLHQVQISNVSRFHMPTWSLTILVVIHFRNCRFLEFGVFVQPARLHSNLPNFFARKNHRFGFELQPVAKDRRYQCATSAHGLLLVPVLCRPNLSVCCQGHRRAQQGRAIQRSWLHQSVNREYCIGGKLSDSSVSSVHSQPAKSILHRRIWTLKHASSVASWILKCISKQGMLQWWKVFSLQNDSSVAPVQWTVNLKHVCQPKCIETLKHTKNDVYKSFYAVTDFSGWM